jgi:hypothetical protein
MLRGCLCREGCEAVAHAAQAGPAARRWGCNGSPPGQIADLRRLQGGCGCETGREAAVERTHQGGGWGTAYVSGPGEYPPCTGDERRGRQPERLDGGLNGQASRPAGRSDERVGKPASEQVTRGQLAVAGKLQALCQPQPGAARPRWRAVRSEHDEPVPGRVGEPRREVHAVNLDQRRKSVSERCCLPARARHGRVEVGEGSVADPGGPTDQRRPKCQGRY